MKPENCQKKLLRDPRSEIEQLKSEAERLKQEVKRINDSFHFYMFVMIGLILWIIFG